MNLYPLLMLAPAPPTPLSPGLSFSSEVLTCEDLREEQPRLHWQKLAAAAAVSPPAPPPSDEGEWAYEERREHGRE